MADVTITVSGTSTNVTASGTGVSLTSDDVYAVSGLEVGDTLTISLSAISGFVCRLRVTRPSGLFGHTTTATVSENGSFADVVESTAAGNTYTITGTFQRLQGTPPLDSFVTRDTLTFNIAQIPSNSTPTANIVGDTSGFTNGAIDVDAASSVDPDGDSLTYAFATVRSGTTVFSQAASSTPGFSFTPTLTGTYITTVTVSDGELSSTNSITTTVFAGTPADPGSNGDYGFEVFDANGTTIINSSELLIRQGGTITTNASGTGSLTLTGVGTGASIGVSTGGEDDATSALTGTTDRTITLSNASASSTYEVYLVGGS